MPKSPAKDYISEVLAGINQKSIEGILKEYNPETTHTISNKELKGTARHFLRREKSRNKEYILCPVPWLYDKVRELEAGFAVSVDKNYFNVYPYVHNCRKSKTKVFPKMPDCVHKAVTASDENYPEWEWHEARIANVNSAVLFINNYVTDLGAGTEFPFEIFDNKLYQQLVTRLADIRGRWSNPRATELRLDQILRNYDSLDETDPGYEPNLTRTNISLINFLFGCEDSIEKEGFIERVSPKKVKPYMQNVYRTALVMRDRKFGELLHEWSGIEPGGDVVQDAYRALLTSGRAPDVKELRKRFGVDIDDEVVLDAYESLLGRGWVYNANELKKLSGIEPPLDIESIQNLYTKLSKIGNREMVDDMKYLKEFSGIAPSEGAVQESYRALLLVKMKSDAVDNAKTLKEFTGIAPAEKTVKDAYLKLTGAGRYDDRLKLWKLSGIGLPVHGWIVPNKEHLEKWRSIVQKTYGS